MSVATSTALMTADELFAMPSDSGSFELIHGALIEMTKPGGNHGRLAFDLAYEIAAFVRQHKLGRVFAAETGFILERNPDTVRAPDAAYIATERMEQARTPKYIPIPPDLAVEVNSPHDRTGEVLAKVGWWLDHGTRLVWVVDPDSRTVTAYASGGVPRVYQKDDTLDGGEVLMGFELPLERLFVE